MWPWLMILAGTLLIIGALVARHRMMLDYRDRLDSDRAAPVTTPGPATSVPPTAPEASAAPAVEAPAPEAPAPAETTPIRSVPATPASAPSTPATLPAPAARATRTSLAPAAPAPAAPVPAAPVPAFARASQTPTVTTRREVKAARAAGQPVVTGPPPLFADLPVGHRLTTAPTVRVRSQDVPLQDWLRYYAEGNAWSGVVQSISDRVTGDPLLQPYFGSLDRTTLQRHVMSTVMMLTGEGVTVGAVRRLADAHLRHVQSGGEPVTEAVWNRMAATLGNALREHNAPEAAILSLNTTVSPLRSVIVARDGA